MATGMGNRKENERKGSMDGRIQEKSNGQMGIYMGYGGYRRCRKRKVGMKECSGRGISSVCMRCDKWCMRV